MLMYKVIKFFTDLQDHDHAYRVGETFPRKGMNVSEDRFKELATNSNKRGVPLIAQVEDEEESIVTDTPAAVIDDDSEEVIIDEIEKPKRGRRPKKKN